MTVQRGRRLTIEGVTHAFGDFTALRDISLAVGAGEIVALLGPSGCGKTTLLRIIAGFIRQDRGHVRFDETVVDAQRPGERGAGIVFQSYALFPHMSVRANIAYGLDARRWDKARTAARVEEMLDLVQMRSFADRMPSQLSGGQQQRIALARCLAVDPQVLLLDEPFGALDKNLRLDMQIEVKRLQRTTGITTVIVTHDQEEALSMADRIAVMNKGRIEQIASPAEIYDRPASLFVNQFVGSTNLLPGIVVSGDAVSSSVRLAGGRVWRAAPAPGLCAGAAISLSVRPERLALALSAAPDALPGAVRTILPLGGHVAYDIDLDGGGSLKAILPRGEDVPAFDLGAAVFVTPRSLASCLVFPS